MEKARKLLIQMMKDNSPVQVKIGTVKSVDKNKLTADVKMLDDEIVLYDVRLQATIDDNADGIYSIPTVGSYVLISLISNDKLMNYISLFTEIDEFIVKVNNIEIVLSKDLIQMNGGKLGGLIKIEEIKIQLDRLTKRVDGIANSLKAGTSAASFYDGGVAIKGTLATVFDILPKENYDNIEDEKVKH